jgi:hypothetical protein
MTSLGMTVASVGMTTISNIPHTEPAEPSGTTVTMNALPEDRDYLELKTGEIFCNPRYSKLRGEEKMISATVSISRAGHDEDYPYSKLRYFPEVQTDDGFHDSSLHFRAYLPPTDFDDLITNLRNGLAPASVSVRLKYDMWDKASPLVFGWEPDGSHLIWNNDTAEARKAGLEITSVKFGYGLLPASGQIKAPEQAPEQTETITNLLSAIRRDMRTFAVFFVVIVIIFYAALIGAR